MKTTGVTEFKAQCLRVIDRVIASREPMIITKRGRPIAKLVPADPRGEDFLGCLAGTIEIVGDIESPVQPAQDWNALR